ncbi:fibronectin type III domain-containing protein [Actinoplanes sp. DH11]|uniref:fibronectin type III domain-containing protein n=1 Tax=Actinoplanes sp. DH11 TaxID=2857011 RepID=UPI001E3B0913|nr:fibronectin type III domain-containing protein [Actinoplanes sp. DH11]
MKKVTRRALGGLVVAALVVGGVAAAASWNDEDPPEKAGGLSAEHLTTMFQQYGNTSGSWLGADRTASLKLPDNRILWLFSDTFLGKPGPDGSRPRTSGLINNSAITQTGAALGALHYGGSSAAPSALVPAGKGNDFAWVGDAAVSGESVQVLVNRYQRSGPGPLDHRLTGTALASFGLPDLTTGPVRDLPLGSRVSWGSEVLPDGEFTYVYGTEAAGDMKFAHLARVRGTDLTAPWEFWTGAAWTATEAQSARILSGVGTNYGMRRIGDRYVLVTHENNRTFSGDFVAYTAESPAGPFGGPHYLFDAPEAKAGHIVYDADLHTDLARPGRLLISYNVNNLDEEVTYGDASIYRPRFVEVEWPLDGSSEEGPDTPSGLTAAPDGAGIAGLAWQPVGGDGISYRVYRRDVTDGQTHFVRLPDSPGSATTFRTDFLVNGHDYEFAVTAVDGDGESPLSAPATMRAAVPPPAAPEGIRVDTLADGRVTVHWPEIPFVQLFKVFQRDLTAGQGDPVTAGTYPGRSATIGPLRHGHDYEITVVAVGGGGDSRPSAPVRARPTVAKPPAPQRPSAQVRSDGSIRLTWPQVAPGLSYQVFRRDVTDGGDFGPPGLATGTTFDTGRLVHGHEYEFTVAAVNSGGAGERSPGVRATADVAAPDEAPTRLVADPGPGRVELSWRSTGSRWYWVFRRDVTAGARDFTREEIPVEGTRATVHNLVDGHQYEFAVAAFGDGGVGPQSKVVRTRLPSALPTGLAARSDGPGAVTVTWNEARSGLSYRIQLRDATAGEGWITDPFPVTGNRFEKTLLTGGHRYEFRLQLADGSTTPAASVTVK